MEFGKGFPQILTPLPLAGEFEATRSLPLLPGSLTTNFWIYCVVKLVGG